MSIIFQKLYDESGKRSLQKRPVVTREAALNSAKVNSEQRKSVVFSVLRQFKFLIAD